MAKQLEIKTEITIKSGIETIWQVMTDPSGFPEWNPMVRKMEGEFVAGQKAKVYFRSSLGILLPFQIEIIQADGKTLVWLGSQLGISGEHYFILKENDGQTELRHGMVFAGTLLPVAAGIIRWQTENSFNAFNRALRDRVESGAYKKAAV